MENPARSGRSVAIVVVTYQSEATVGACLDAVERSTPHPHSVVVVDNGSTDRTRAIVRERSAALVENAQNRGFAAACNQGIASTAGDFIVVLHPDALVGDGWLEALLAGFQASDVAAVAPAAACDAGVAPRPVKTVRTHCLALRRTALAAIGGFDERFTLGAEDLALSLAAARCGFRLMEAPACAVDHRPGDSFRSIPGWKREALTLQGADLLEAELSAGGADPVRAAAEFFGDAAPKFRGREKVSIVIPVWNNSKFTRLCLRSVAQFTSHPHEVIVVDNGSTDDTEQVLASFPDVRVIRNDTNRGFAAACNQGMRAATGKHLMLLNNDVVVTPQWLEGLLDHPRLYPQIGVVGPRTNCASGPQVVKDVGYSSLENLGTYALRYRRECRAQRMIFPRVTGLCLLVTEACWNAVGLLDERFGIGNYEDDDYCVRAKLAGFECCIAGDVFVHHFGSQTFKTLDVSYNGLLEENKKKFFDKWNFLKEPNASPEAIAAAPVLIAR